CWGWPASSPRSSCWRSAGCRAPNEPCHDPRMPSPGRFVKSSSLSRWLRPAPDSLAACDQRLNRPVWTHFIHLVWTVWVFLTPVFAGGEYGLALRWAWLTLLSYPLFLLLYARSVLAPPRHARLAPPGMVLRCFALLRWHPSGLSYCVLGCVMLQPRGKGRLMRYLCVLAVLNAALLACARYIGYPWVSRVWIPTVTAVVGVVVMVDRRDSEREAAPRLSHDEL